MTVRMMPMSFLVIPSSHFFGKCRLQLFAHFSIAFSLYSALQVIKFPYLRYLSGYFVEICRFSAFDYSQNYIKFIPCKVFNQPKW